MWVIVLKLDWLKLCLTRNLLHFGNYWCHMVCFTIVLMIFPEICMKVFSHEFQSDAIVICFLHVWMVKVYEMLFSGPIQNCDCSTIVDRQQKELSVDSFFSHQLICNLARCVHRSLE